MFNFVILLSRLIRRWKNRKGGNETATGQSTASEAGVKEPAMWHAQNSENQAADNELNA